MNFRNVEPRQASIYSLIHGSLIVHHSTFVCLFLILLSGVACRTPRQTTKPIPIDTASPEYAELVQAFYVGLAALQVGEQIRAEEHLTRATQLVPDEPAAWANLGLLSLRQSEFDIAAERLEKARQLAPDASQVYFLIGQLALSRGDPANALESFRRAVDLDGGNAHATYALALMLEQRGGEEAGTNRDEAATQVTVLTHLLVRVPEYRQGFAELKSSPADIAPPVTRFLRLPFPVSIAAPPDEGLAYSLEAVPDFGASSWNWTGTVLLSGEQKPLLVAANGREVRLAGGARLNFPGGSSAVAPSRDGVLALDFNYDFKTDFALAGTGGLRLLQQNSKGGFDDVTIKAKLAASVEKGAYVGAWAADLESDGDLDLILGAQTGPPVVLRNNGDGTFTQQPLFAEVIELRSFAWADFDRDGDADAAMLDAQGRLHVFANERSGQFIARSLPHSIGPAMAISLADLYNDGHLDLIVLQRDGAVLRLSDKSEGTNWQVTELCRWQNAGSEPADQSANLLIADLDNNGSLDLLVSGSVDGQIWLADGFGGLKPLATSLPLARILSVSDITDDG